MEFRERKSPRLKGYDYSLPGAYFVTICTKDRKNLFEIESVGNDLCVVHPQNALIHKWIKETENKYPNVKIDKYVIMPNHIHIIIIIKERHIGRSLHDIVRWFKTMVTNQYITLVKDGEITAFDKKIWQRSFHDHIIRGDDDYLKIWNYIDTNPLKWELDCFYTKKPQ